MRDDAYQQQENEHQRYEVERVVELACKSLSPNDQALLRWLAGTQEPKSPWGSDSSSSRKERY